MVVIAVINMALNYHKVEYYFLWNSGTMPLSLVTLFAMAYGVVMGVLYLGYVRSNQKQKRALLEQKKKKD
jgi:uncharacterized integral membrane protein